MLLERTKKLKGKKSWECLTILEMVQRNFSECDAELICTHVSCLWQTWLIMLMMLSEQL